MSGAEGSLPVADGSGMSLDEVKRTLRSIIAEAAALPPEIIEDDSRFDDDLALDSLSFVSVQVEIEKTFEIDCSLEELGAVEPRFDVVAELVAGKLGEG